MRVEEPPLLPVIVGPTGVGKTAAAAVVAEVWGGEVVSADSRQIYRGMEIGSGAPPAEVLGRVRHHFVGEVSPERRISAGEFAREARGRIEAVWGRGKRAVVVGGSGLYVQALVDGLAPLPPPDPQLREALRVEAARRGLEEMGEELRRVDPEYAPRVGRRDRKRLLRALEVYRQTGKPFSVWHRDDPGPKWCRPRFFGLVRPREELGGIIRRRILEQVEAGWLGEVEELARRWGGWEQVPPVVREALGYRDWAEHLQGRLTFEEALERVVVATQRFAKRQLTWFRADPRVEWREGSGREAEREWARWIMRTISELN